MGNMFITVTGFKHYYGEAPFKIGNLVRCAKDPENGYDSEAIKCVIPSLGTIGYIANSPETMARGTMSAGRVYDKVCSKFYARVMFATRTKIICRVEEDPAGLEEEYLNQFKDDWCEADGDTVTTPDDEVVPF